MTQTVNEEVSKARKAAEEYKQKIANRKFKQIRINAKTVVIVPEHKVTPEYIEKLKIFVNDLSLFYNTTAELVEKSTKKSIENNELTITAINEISKASLRILNFNNDINESYNYSLTLLNKSQIYFSNNFYQNYFAQNPTYTIETIKQEISILAPEN